MASQDPRGDHSHLIVGRLGRGRGATTGQATFTKGRYAYLCFITDPDGTPHYHLGMFGFTRVNGDN